MNQRVEFVLRSMQTENFRALCQEYGISTKTGYKWRERFVQQGLGGMEERSRRPQSSPRTLGEGVVCDIIRLKRKHQAWGPRKIRAVYARLHGQTPSESSFKRVLERAGFTEKRRVRSMPETGRLHSSKVAQGPNEVWTVDFKGWWHAGGRRCEPLTVRDEYSRYLLELRLMPDARGQTVRGAFERLFEVRGLPETIRSDNGVPFASVTGLLGLSQLSAWWVALGIDLVRGRPGCPQDNGGHERMHLDVSRELEARGQGEPQAGFDEWRRTFNEERPHEALGMRTPAEFYVNSTRQFEGTPEDLSYPGMELRKVHQTGYISWKDQPVFLSGALRGWSVGLEPVAGQNRWKVWFGRLLLGELDPHTASFERIKATAQDLKTPDGNGAGDELERR